MKLWIAFFINLQLLTCLKIMKNEPNNLSIKNPQGNLSSTETPLTPQLKSVTIIKAKNENELVSPTIVYSDTEDALRSTNHSNKIDQRPSFLTSVLSRETNTVTRNKNEQSNVTFDLHKVSKFI